MPIAKINGLNINYQILGEDGPPVALTTGGRRGYAEFLPLARRLAAEGFRVFLHDRRNTGASDISFDADEVEEVVWADDLHSLLAQHDALPAYVGGSSAGARTSILFCLRHPEAVRGLLLMRVTGGPFAAERLPENYYGQFIQIAREGGMEAICATEQYQERFAENPTNLEVMENMDPEKYISVLSRWHELFVAGGHLPVMGVTPEQLASITAPTIVIPGNDNTHSSNSGRIAHQSILGSELHELSVADQDVALIPYPEWAPYEPEITRVFVDFMRRTEAARNQE